MSLHRDVEEVLVVLGGDPAMSSQIAELASRGDVLAALGQHLNLRRGDLMPSAFDYQTELVGAMLSRVSRSGSALLSLPTGAGKTRTAMLAVLQSLSTEPRRRWLWLAPSIELVEQAALTLSGLWKESPEAPDLHLAIRTSDAGDAAVWLNTPQAVHRSRIDLGTFDSIIFDEAHQLGAATFQAAVERCRGRSTSVFGLSATPGRVDERETRGLVNYFGGDLLVSSVLGKNPVLELQDRGVLSRLSFKRVGSNSGQDSQGSRVRQIAKLAVHLAERRRRTLVFTSSVAEAIGIAIHLREIGVAADYVDGSLPDEQRRARIQDFASGKTTVLFNQKLLATGYDCPAVTDVVLGSKVGSPILFEQIIGRAARGPLIGGARLARIWEFDDHLAIHGLPQSYYRYRDYEWLSA